MKQKHRNFKRLMQQKMGKGGMGRMGGRGRGRGDARYDDPEAQKKPELTAWESFK